MYSIYSLHKSNKQFISRQCKRSWYTDTKYNLLEYYDKFSKTLGSLWQYCRDVPNNPITDLQYLSLNRNLQSLLIMFVIVMQK